ncbi:hypothetical protein Tco_0612502 [Tanacetum coccineum]
MKTTHLRNELSYAVAEHPWKTTHLRNGPLLSLALDWCDGGLVSALARASFNLHRSLAEELPAGRFPVRRQVRGCVVQEGDLR